MVLSRVAWESVLQSKGVEESGGGWVRLSRAVSGRDLDCFVDGVRVDFKLLRWFPFH